MHLREDIRAFETPNGGLYCFGAQVNQPDYRQPSYPVVQFLVGKGTALAVIVALCTFSLMAYAGYATTTLWLYPASIVGATGVFIILMSYVEVLKIIADTLLPKY